MSYNLSLTFSETALLVKNFYDPDYQYTEDGEFDWADWQEGYEEVKTQK